MEDLRYPIGPFVKPVEADITPEWRSARIDRIEATPAALRAAVSGLDERQLETRYRPGGWTVRQVVHHLPDSHLNSYCRFKLAITEKRPTIRTYEEAPWAELEDGRSAPVEISLDLLETLHRRWVLFLRSLTVDDWARELVHPEVGILDLDAMLELYAWHGDHHVAHVTSLRQREGWLDV